LPRTDLRRKRTVSKHRTVKTGFDPAKRNEGDEVMATPTRIQGENPIFLHGDGEKIVFKLDLFPELIQALRDGDLLTGRLFCAQLFDSKPALSQSATVTRMEFKSF